AADNSPMIMNRDENSPEFVGWSDNKDEVFTYQSKVMVMDVSPTVTIPVRFELWFESADTYCPDGSCHRKLMEEVFKVHGMKSGSVPSGTYSFNP
ncbi:MAG TPA: hypothetical protein VMW66_04785, partial [Elusimicrobiales bacterium]|nr:hypothetical protein [Elusimicrobiales bacterium]